MSTSNPALIDAMTALNTLPLWDRYKTINTREPQHYDPLHWPWATLSPLIDRISREISMEEAERRVLLLTHPGFPGTIFTTPTLSAGIQVLEPGESAHAHRHTLAALRLVMMGEGAATITDGKHCPMEPGDLILTPAMTWHEHEHKGSERMVWFDGLDYPLARQLGTVFFENGPGPIPDRGLASLKDDALNVAGVLPDDTPNTEPYSPLFRYAWKNVKTALDSMPSKADGTRRLRYVNPATGGAVMPTLDCFALRLAGSQVSQKKRTTSTAIAVVIEGEGETRIDGTTIAWKQHDVFTLPRWKWIEHQASHGSATLFLMTDRELLARIDHLREEAWA